MESDTYKKKDIFLNKEKRKKRFLKFAMMCNCVQFIHTFVPHYISYFFHNNSVSELVVCYSRPMLHQLESETSYIGTTFVKRNTAEIIEEVCELVEFPIQVIFLLVFLTNQESELVQLITRVVMVVH